MKQFKFKIRGNKYDAKIIKFENNTIDIEVNGTSYHVEIEQNVIATKTPTLVRSKVKTNKEDAKIKQTETVVKAPLPGTIFKMMVNEGDKIKTGDTLLIMEAMKMENNIQSETSGIIKSIKVKEGDAVLQNDILIEIG